MRLFIAVNFNGDIRPRLLALRDELRSRSRHGNFSSPGNLHLTLVFLGECDAKEAAAVKSVMDAIEFEPFFIVIERVGRFRRDGGDIWWAGVGESKPLTDLQRGLTDKLIIEGFTLDKRKYSPHVTLGRKVATDASPWEIEPVGEQVRKIVLMKSERVGGKLVYTAIHENKSRENKK